MKMTQNNFGLLYVMLVICQIILCNFTHLGPYIMLTMLPVMVLCIPTGTGAVAAMIIAFFSGLSVEEAHNKTVPRRRHNNPQRFVLHQEKRSGQSFSCTCHIHHDIPFHLYISGWSRFTPILVLPCKICRISGLQHDTRNNGDTCTDP